MDPEPAIGENGDVAPDETGPTGPGGDTSSSDQSTIVPDGPFTSPDAAAAVQETAEMIGSRADISLSQISDVFRLLDPPLLPEERGRFADYPVMGLLGRGGMGLVFEAEDPALRRRVAIKILRPEQSGEKEKARFLDEARMAASLRDDHIVTVYQVGEWDGLPYLVLERLRGESLEDRLRRERWLPLPEALRIARQVALGLRAAHSVGLVHRDIKPANIWLEQSSDFGSPPRVKILDFGLARTSDDLDDAATEGSIAGTPAYMAPEQVTGESIGPRTDLYALGAVLYRMITGHTPFRARNPADMLAAIVHDPTPDPEADGMPRLPRPVLALLRDLLDKDPGRRPPTAAGVIDRLKVVESGLHRDEEDEAPPPSEEPRVPRSWFAGGAWIGIVAIASSILVGVFMTIYHIHPWDPDESRSDVQAPGPAAEPDRTRGIDPATRRPAATTSGTPIKVGLLHSRTGPLANLEQPMLQVELLAIEQINGSGGVLGRPVQPILAQGSLDDDGFAACARRMIAEDKVEVLIGCLSSGSRKRVKEVCEAANVMLFYPMNFEGLEVSPNVVYVGGGVNQQLLPMIEWSVGFLKRRKFYLLGTENLFSRASHEILKGALLDQHLRPVGARSLRPDQVVDDFVPIVREIQAAGTDIVIDTLSPQLDQIFFLALNRLGIDAATLPVVSLCLGEDQLRTLDPAILAGHYSALNYFDTVEGEDNRRFLEDVHERYPLLRVTAAVETAYLSVWFWKEAAELAGSLETDKVREGVRDLELKTPEGLVRIDPEDLYGSRVARVGRLERDGRFKIVYHSPEPMPTTPYPPPHDRKGWDRFLEALRSSWGGRWSMSDRAAAP